MPNNNLNYKKSLICASLLLSFGVASNTWAGATFDGTMGSNTSTLSGDFTVTESDGTLAGSNLFHSFSDFSINAGESATFTGTSPINNVVSRVTGTEASTFNGALTSAITGANFYFMNPNGIIFKEGASINVDGSFYATTSDYVGLGDDGIFNADSNTTSTLTSSPPTSFGFLDNNVGKITLQGTQLLKYVNYTQPDNATFSLISGDISIEQASADSTTLLSGFGVPGSTGSFIALPGNRFELVSVASAGEVVSLSGGGYDLSSFETLGNISITGGSIIDSNDVYIRGGNVVINDSMIAPGYSNLLLGLPKASGGTIDIAATEQFSITGTTPIQTFAAPYIPRPGGGSFLSGITTFSGNAVVGGSLAIVNSDAVDINISGSQISVTGAAGIMSTRLGPGAAGDIIISGDVVEVVNGALISNFNTYDGAGGNITINANQVTLDGQNNSGITGLLTSSNFNSKLRTTYDSALAYADAGNIIINATGVGGLTVKNGAFISSESRSLGNAGDIVINASDISLSRDEESVVGSIASQSVYAGDAGDITINATNNLEISGGFEVSATTSGMGTGGDISITAGNNINISGENSGIASAAPEPVDAVKDYLAYVMIGSNNFANLLTAFGLAADSTMYDALGFLQAVFGYPIGLPVAGDAGSITLAASTLNMKSNSRITSSTSSDGNGGTINIQVDKLEMEKGAEIRSRSGLYVKKKLKVGSGNGGDITITANESVSMKSGSSISSSSLGTGDAGNINLDAGDSLKMAKGSITTEAFDSGNGGDISILAKKSVSMESGSRISSSSFGTGLAGDIYLNAGDYLKLKDSSITTEATVSDGGNISIFAIKEIYLDESDITTSVENGTGSGGNIFIDPEFFIMRGSNILANAYGGDGGNIELIAKHFITSADSSIDASSSLGMDGEVSLSSPDEDVSDDLAVLPDNYLDVTNLIAERCGAKSGTSSLVNAGSAGIAINPDGYLPSFAVAENTNGEGGIRNIASSKSKQWAKSYIDQSELSVSQLTCAI